MRKEDLVRRVATLHELNQEQASYIIDAVFREIEEALVEGDTVSIPGFGTFRAVEDQFSMRDPDSGEVTSTETRVTVSFLPSRSIIGALNAVSEETEDQSRYPEASATEQDSAQAIDYSGLGGEDDDRDDI